MGDAFPDDRKQNREALLDDVDKIAPVLQACGANSEELGTLSAETVIASPTMGMVKLRLCTEMGGSEAEPVTEMMVLEQFAYLERLFTDGNVRSAAISFFPAARAASDRNGCRVSGRRRFFGGIHHA
jgi:indole-3-acetate monooxygenase